MGANSSCPAGFERTVFWACRVQCPEDFRYLESPQGDMCVYRYDNRRTVSLTRLPIPDIADPSTSIYQDEQDRFSSELTRVRNQIRDDDVARQALSDAKTVKSGLVQDYNRIQSDYAVYNEIASLREDIQKTSQILKPMRAKTAPAEDLQKERRAISFDLQRDMFFVQLALFLVVLSLVSYLILPLEWAHGITFLLMCVGIGTGFFLRR